MSIVITNKEVYTDAPATKRVHRINTEHYFTRCTKLPDDTAENFEEVDISQVPQNEDITPDTNEWHHIKTYTLRYDNIPSMPLLPTSEWDGLLIDWRRKNYANSHLGGTIAIYGISSMYGAAVYIANLHYGCSAKIEKDGDAIVSTRMHLSSNNVERHIVRYTADCRTGRPYWSGLTNAIFANENDEIEVTIFIKPRKDNG